MVKTVTGPDSPQQPKEPRKQPGPIDILVSKIKTAWKGKDKTKSETPQQLENRLTKLEAEETALKTEINKIDQELDNLTSSNEYKSLKESAYKSLSGSDASMDAQITDNRRYDKITSQINVLEAKKSALQTKSKNISQLEIPNTKRDLEVKKFNSLGVKDLNARLNQLTKHNEDIKIYLTSKRPNHSTADWGTRWAEAEREDYQRLLDKWNPITEKNDQEIETIQQRLKELTP